MFKKIFVAPFLVSLINAQAANAAEYSLAIQPILPPERVEALYKPLADYLSEMTGQTIKIQTFRSFRSYWYNMKRLSGFDMVLDGPHFTDYRVKHDGYKVIAKQPDTVSFTVVTKDDLFLFDVEELADMKVATMMAPGMGALRLKEYFLTSDKEPIMISAYNADDSIKLIQDNKAVAAVIPTPLVGNYEHLNVVATTEPTPHVGFSVSPSIPDDIANKIKVALIESSSDEDLKIMLAGIHLAPFIKATNKDYDGYAGLLELAKKR